MTKHPSSKPPHSIAEKPLVSDEQKEQVIAKFLDDYPDEDKPILWAIVGEILAQGLTDAAYGRLKRDHGTVNTYRIYNGILTLRETCGAGDDEIAWLLQERKDFLESQKQGPPASSQPPVSGKPVPAIDPEAPTEVMATVPKISRVVEVRQAAGQVIVTPVEEGQEEDELPDDINQYVDDLSAEKKAKLRAIVELNPNDRIGFIEVRDDQNEVFLEVTEDLAKYEEKFGCTLEELKQACLVRLNGGRAEIAPKEPQQEEEPVSRSWINWLFGRAKSS